MVGQVIHAKACKSLISDPLRKELLSTLAKVAKTTEAKTAKQKLEIAGWTLQRHRRLLAQL